MPDADEQLTNYDGRDNVSEHHLYCPKHPDYDDSETAICKCKEIRTSVNQEHVENRYRELSGETAIHQGQLDASDPNAPLEDRAKELERRIEENLHE